MDSIGELAGGFFVALGFAGMLASSTLWVIAMRRARRGESTARLARKLWWRPKSPGGNDLFVHQSMTGRPLDVGEYVPAYLLEQRRSDPSDEGRAPS